MEYHNYNTPLERIDEGFVKQILSGEFDPACGCERGRKEREKINTDCGCNSRSTSSRTCRYNRRYSRCGCNRSDEHHSRVTGREDNTCVEYERETVCGCGDCDGFTPPELHGVPHSMVYSPHHHFEGLYESEDALKRGTIFRCLDFPFSPTACRSGNCNNENKGCR